MHKCNRQNLTFVPESRKMKSDWRSRLNTLHRCECGRVCVYVWECVLTQVHFKVAELCINKRYKVQNVKTMRPYYACDISVISTCLLSTSGQQAASLLSFTLTWANSPLLFSLSLWLWPHSPFLFLSLSLSYNQLNQIKWRWLIKKSQSHSLPSHDPHPPFPLSLTPFFSSALPLTQPLFIIYLSITYHNLPLSSLDSDLHWHYLQC